MALLSFLSRLVSSQTESSQMVCEGDGGSKTDQRYVQAMCLDGV
jgi:hypothetical protein